MNATKFSAIAMIACLGLGVPGASLRAQASAEPPVDGGRAENDSHSKDRINMSDARIAAGGIELGKAGAITLKNRLVLNGVVRANQEILAQVTPRFAGIAREIFKRIGDDVRKDDVMAKIESNLSMTQFDLKAPFSGTIVDRQISLGEYVSEQKAAFVVADLSTVWVDLLVYVQNFGRVSVGDEVTIDLDDGKPSLETKVTYVSPVGLSETQSTIVRAEVANPDNRLRPGFFVRGTVILRTRQVPVAVKADALQVMENKEVVFVREGDKLEAREVKTGERDNDYVEILDGLSAGEVYAAENSFIIKAEIGKSELEHE
jgi:cobalt-zinc-cadmium efflux system membrane fusion protein